MVAPCPATLGAPCPRTFRLRALLLTTAVTLALAMPLAQAQEKLPDIGSSAGELLTPARQAEYGAMMLRELRNYGYLLDDPLVNDWLQTMGTRLGSNSDQPRQPYTFFVMKDRQINAFATLGGYIGVNAGLVLTAEREDEVAAVLSHEIAHVTQQHVLRGVERAQRDQIPILLGMLAAVVAAQASNSTSSGNATMAAISSGMGLMQQRQINYTRSNESEADRLGIRTLSRSGYDVDAMAGFFERMSAAMRGNEGGYSVPEFLRTHPVNITRISEAKARAEQMKKDTVLLTTSTPSGERRERVNPADPGLAEPLLRGNNPLLPSSVLRVPVGQLARGASGDFEWARERLRVLSADSTAELEREYADMAKRQKDGLNDAQRYGQALAVMRGGRSGATQARQTLASLLQTRPDNLWLALGLGEAESRAGLGAQANTRFEQLLREHPNSRPVALTYAEILNEQGTREAGQRAQAMLRPLLSQSGNDPVFQQRYARASELAGDSVRASEAYAEAAFLSGRPEQSLMQLQALKRNPALDYVGRARVDARIEAITPTVLELRRQGVQDPDLDRR
ncbi:M48 family metallopeptidase [Stenotrophomonas maltophilia]|uniref:Putative beta-barrel assembly-enhancing protease n=1 Tax=Stenotrophomonas maltophilia (strain K279a) TaxID=522373 RepID=B2FQQ2_STRMK|nr:MULTISPECIES: M48 family metalloprotease [Stenotrophomonas]EKT4072321.1 M48 family metallopeptidase [Stenotrophomonas maltophilia]EKT4080981.1 M48 family metallopeptidase [Stenotrophomonas maltophilia]EKT4105662.1 M48 family metallopeptidase [Stenotrophomonas maltophilia]EKU9964601.1 M48 family metallopeptidase [Stenotrophomonas maltophilia]EKU9982279.1 M48 family metallopeptidase [Stenotrophomonas maltophilia]